MLPKFIRSVGSIAVVIVIDFGRERDPPAASVVDLGSIAESAAAVPGVGTPAPADADVGANDTAALLSLVVLLIAVFVLWFICSV